MSIPTPDEAFDDEFSERLLESLDELKASFKKLQDEIAPEVANLSEALGKIGDRLNTVESKVQRRWREIILTDDYGIEHRIPKSGFVHIAYIQNEVDDVVTKKFPLPTTRFPCLRVFSASFPGVCYDFRVKGEIPARFLGIYRKIGDQKKVLSDRAFLRGLAEMFVDGGGFTLEAGKKDDAGELSIEVSTYQYLH